MRFLSVCSGIEAASVAWNPLGWKAVAFSEIEPFPCAVLAHHYPDTPNWGDMTKHQPGERKQPAARRPLPSSRRPSSRTGHCFRLQI